MGAHPGGLFSRDTPVDPYGEDLDFWTEAGAISHAGGEAFDDWIRHWVLDPVDQADYVSRIDPERIALLRRRAEPDSWQDDEAANPPDLDAPINAWERAAAYGAGYLADRVLATEADARSGGRRGRQPGGVAGGRAWPASRARTACSPPSSACGDTSPRPPTRSCSTTGASPRPR